MPDIKKYLNRDGLDEYNSLLPHSSTKMQTYVNEWMDEHPEASTTVQDGAITERKLADKSVSLRTLADDTVHMLKGAILTGNLGGNVLSADDAYSAPPVALAIEGKSTQDGTPTPDATVEIVSLEQANLTFEGKNIANPTSTPSSRTSHGVTFGWNGETFSANGTTTADNTDSMYIRIDNFPILRAGSTYTFSLQGTFDTGGSGTTFYFWANKLGNESATLRYIFGAANKGVWVYRPTEDTVLRSFAIRIGASGVTVNIAAKLQIEIGATATPYQPYEATNVLLNLTHALRSLPDGTHDTLSFAYLRPSTREGWAWYSAEMVQNVLLVDMGDLTWVNYYGNRIFYANVSGAAMGTSDSLQTLCEIFTPYRTSTLAWFGNYAPANSIALLVANTASIGVMLTPETAYESAEAFKTAMSGVYAQVPIATPITTQLDPVELPFTAAPDFTIWSDPSTGLQIEYVRDANIVIQNIEQAIADQ